MINASVKAFLSEMGKKGGKASGPRKARSPEHYKRLAEMKKAKAGKASTLDRTGEP